MATHPFHREVGAIIRRQDFPKSAGLKILKDEACDEEGHKIYVYNRTTGTPLRFADVDILIATKKKPKEAKVIIEIEESNVKPVQIFGKFFASAFSNCYLPKGGGKKGYLPIAEPALFVQVLKSSKPKKGKSKKPEQWKRVDESIQAVLETLFKGEWQYSLFWGPQPEALVNIAGGKGLVDSIQAFLEQNP